MRCLSPCLHIVTIIVMNQTLKFAEGKPASRDVKACGLNGVCNCQADSTTVDCTRRKLTYLPDGIPCNTSVLYLKENLITKVPKTWMLQFDHLKMLDISSNQISEPFELPSNLLILDVSSNQLKESFKLPPKLLELNAEWNQLETIEDFFRGGCSMLTKVDLEAGKYTEIPNGMFKDCSHLRSLQLRHNHLSYLGNDTLKGLTALSFLTLSYESARPVEVGLLTDACKNLNKLILASFSSSIPLPAGIFRGCSKLSELYIFNTGLSEVLDGTFIGCSEVSVFSLANNRFISTLPGNLFNNIRNIINFDLGRLNLTAVPENLFQNVGGISRLSLGYNNIKVLPDNLFSRTMHTIFHLFLCYNELSYLSEAFFRNLPYLREIYLNNNNLQRLEYRQFLGTQLEVIYLVQNNITEIRGRPFLTGNESTVRLLQIADNPLNDVTSEAISDLVLNASVTMTCWNTTLPTNLHDIHMHCVASSVPIVLKDFREIKWSMGGTGGYICTLDGDCKSCEVGTYGNKINTGCISCPAGGFFQDQVGMVSKEFGGIACKKCNNGTFVKDGAGASALSCNVCPEGTNQTRHAGFRACFCLENYYRSNRFGKCFPCPNEGIKCSNDFMRIKYGFFWQWKATDSQVYTKFIINLQTEDDSYEKRWSTYNGSIPRTHRCPIDTNCINDALDLEGNCRNGYQGWMCTVCQKGYYKLFGWCHKCQPEFVFGMMLLCIFSITFLWFGIVKPLARNQQANASSRRSFGDLIISKVKILFGFYQVVDSYWHAIGRFLWFASLQLAISRIIEVMSFTLSSIFVSPSCYISWFKWNPYTKLWALYSTLLLTTFILVVVYFIACLVWSLRPSGTRVLNVKTSCLKLFTFTMFATYTETCDVIFQLYNCDKFFLYENNNTTIQLLHSHYNISCDTDLYRRYTRVYALPGWILISTFPVIMWTLLYKYSRNSAGQESMGEYQYPEWLLFMCENYKSHCWYWEILELGRKVLLTFLPLAFGWEGVFIIIGLFASGLFLALHAFVRPMKDSWDNVLQFLSLLFLNFNMIVSAVHSSGNVEPVMYIIVSIMNVSMFVALTGEAVWRIFVLLQAHYLCRRFRSGSFLNSELESLLSDGPMNQ